MHVPIYIPRATCTNQSTRYSESLSIRRFFSLLLREDLNISVVLVDIKGVSRGGARLEHDHSCKEYMRTYLPG